MEELKDGLLTFRPDTLYEVRKDCNLEQPGRMEEAINILNDWIQKQDHFLKKDYDRDYLERVIIISKGLIERAKTNLEKRCTIQTVMPDLLQPYNAREDFKNTVGNMTDVTMPKLTPDHCRVVILKDEGNEYGAALVRSFQKKVISYFEYLMKHDYSKGMHIIIDYRKMKLAENLSSIDFSEYSRVNKFWRHGYGLRVKGCHVLINSRFADIILATVRNMFPNIKERVTSHSSVESLYKIVPREILPVEYGGEERSIYKLFEEWVDVLSTKEHIDFLKSISEAKIDETKKPIDRSNEELMGTSGTFRSLAVD